MRDQAEPHAGTEIPPRVVLYDGVCGLCHRSVRFLLRVDRDHKLRYATLQGQTAARLRERHPEIPDDLDTVVYVEEGRVYKRSRAFTRLARHLRYPWKILSWLVIIPWPLSDLVYRLVARLRYRLFGKHESCPLPSPENRQRFLP